MKYFLCAISVAVSIAIPATALGVEQSAAKKGKGNQTEVPKSTPGGGKPLTAARVSVNGSVAEDSGGTKADARGASVSTANSIKKQKMLKFNPKEEQRSTQ